MDVKPGEEAPKPSLKKLGGAFVGLLQGHLELLGIELQEEKARTFRLFLLAGISLILGLLVLVGLSAAVVIAFWDTHRIAAILVLCTIYAIVMLICITRALKLAKACATPFQATLEELARDRERLLP
ncbi:phage holin family protein [Stutzerimonas stutzeri]|uniref:phage holin family protein n=1 Tax=Stutzerimonas sp. S1 TaxID=3030652 RepID=UPI0022243634|nr:phage holin family protein [Stutzerimonas sp. S1]MCW3148795.1 phage holin family protein [Stutzerimonas sp. S1]